MPLFLWTGHQVQETPGEQWIADGKKLNLNTLIREAPSTSSEQELHGSHFLKELTSECVPFVIFFQLMVAFGYKPLSFHLLPASQLFKVPVGLCHDLAFQFTTRPCALTQTTQLQPSAALAASLLQEEACATKRGWYSDVITELLKMQSAHPRPQKGSCGLVYL